MDAKREVNCNSWAIALHGGAGAISREMPTDREHACRHALKTVLEAGRSQLAQGASATDVVEAVATLLEEEPLFNAGHGAVFTSEGTHELESSIMDGSTLQCGAASNLATVRNPIQLARLVMERTPHILLSGSGAERFADEMNVERVDNDWFDTPHRRLEYERFRDRQPLEQEGSTIGVVARDVEGCLVAATSTGGMTGKMPGRIGDTPIPGAGTWADGHCAVSCTGQGEEFIRHAVGHEVSSGMRWGMLPLYESVEQVVASLPPAAGGVIAVGQEGPPVAIYSSRGMYRGLADGSGLFEVAIWEE
jgi:beta-aspartyl-peptidase (threonine type)